MSCTCSPSGVVNDTKENLRVSIASEAETMADPCRYICFLRTSNTTDSPIISKALHSNSIILHCITIITIRSLPSLLTPQQHTTIEHLVELLITDQVSKPPTHPSPSYPPRHPTDSSLRRHSFHPRLTPSPCAAAAQEVSHPHQSDWAAVFSPYPEPLSSFHSGHFFSAHKASFQDHRGTSPPQVCRLN